MNMAVNLRLPAESGEFFEQLTEYQLLKEFFVQGGYLLS
jgi:hypothetical protein